MARSALNAGQVVPLFSATPVTRDELTGAFAESESKEQIKGLICQAGRQGQAVRRSLILAMSPTCWQRSAQLKTWPGPRDSALRRRVLCCRRCRQFLSLGRSRVSL